MQRASGVVADIADAAHGQASGLAQLDRAVAEIGRVTQQNAASAEQSASAAEELSSQAAELSAVVARFELGDAPGEGRRARRDPLSERTAAGATSGAPAGTR